MRLFRLLRMGILFLVLEPASQLVYRFLLFSGAPDGGFLYDVFVTADCLFNFLGLYYLWLSMKQFLKILRSHPSLIEDIDHAAGN
jgi:hypothetical protein